MTFRAIISTSAVSFVHSGSDFRDLRSGVSDWRGGEKRGLQNALKNWTSDTSATAVADGTNGPIHAADAANAADAADA